MKPNKIKIHNLDKEVLDYFYTKNKPISYDQLDRPIIDDIKNGVGATHAYNDAEIRYRVAEVERNKIDTQAAEATYSKKNETYSKQEIDNKVKTASDVLDAKVLLKLDKKEAAQLFVEKKDGAITENLLSQDLISKVNARYENRRPASGGNSNITDSDFNNLKTRVGNNEKSITDINNYIGTNVLTKADKLTQNNFDEAVNVVLNSARLKTIPIELNDLSTELSNMITTGDGGSAPDMGTFMSDVRTLKENLFKGNDGEVLFGITDINDKVDFSFIFLDDDIIITETTDLQDAKLYAVQQGINYISDLQANILYSYDSAASAWNQVADDTPQSYLKGKFSKEYKTDDIFFGTKKVINISALQTQIDNNKKQLEAINTKVNALMELQQKIPDIERRLTALESRPNGGGGSVIQ